MKRSAAKKVPVIGTYRSPMNAKQWLCVLACGHEKWATSARRPKWVAKCDACERPDK